MCAWRSSIFPEIVLHAVCELGSIHIIQPRSKFYRSVCRWAAFVDRVHSQSDVHFSRKNNPHTHCMEVAKIRVLRDCTINNPANSSNLSGSLTPVTIRARCELFAEGTEAPHCRLTPLKRGTGIDPRQLRSHPRGREGFPALAPWTLQSPKMVHRKALTFMKIFYLLV